MIRAILTIAVILCIGPASPAIEPSTSKPARVDDASLEFFEKQVRPLLVSRCYKCHGPDVKEPKGGLRLDSRAALLAGGDTGATIAPGEPAKSLLIDAINYGDVYQMPPKTKLPAEDIAILTRWVKLGAPWPKQDDAKHAPDQKGFNLQMRRTSHWAWQPIRPPRLPVVKDTQWPRSPLDSFILARLEKKGLSPALPTDRSVLIRRLYFDLAGLPPALEEVNAFLDDDSPDAVGKVVDRLLASPRFGERWTRHWLDLVRYAESRGHERDFTAANAYQYRDFLIRALNADVPYDRFVTEHIAGDLMKPPRLHPSKGFNESILGTGFWFLGEWVHSPIDIREDEINRLDNMIDVMGKTFLGLTIGCARCHEHKFDAISQQDYYALFGFLQSSGYRQVRFESQTRNLQVSRELKALRDERGGRIVKALCDSQRPVLEKVAIYLMAARQAILAKRERPEDAGRHISALAAQYGLDAGVLGRWVDHLATAKDKPDDLLHLWARIAHKQKADDATWLAELVKPTVKRWKSERAKVDVAFSSAQVIIDYAAAQKANWMVDGVAFGLGPVRSGDIRLGNDPHQPVERVFIRGAAQSDPILSDLTLAAGVEREPGRLGDWVASGRSIRTPTFTIQSGKIFYLVQGAGRAYVVVDSHRMNAGPLHGGLIKKWDDGDKNRPRWIEHNLSRYKEHRAHVEFSVEGSGNLAVLTVVQAERAPSHPAEPPNRLLLELLGESRADSPEAIAQTYQQVLTEASRKLAAGEITGSPYATDCARLADWIVNHLYLFGSPDTPLRKRAAQFSQVFLNDRKELLRRFNRSSHLAMAMWEGSGEDEYLLIRGSHKTPDERVPRRFLEAIAGAQQPPITVGSGRLELARRMTDPANPLIGRVLVNRVWHHLLGRGIVATVDNFGVLGERPTHPELLDYLSNRFIEGGWSVKRLIKTIVTSQTYQMSSRPSEHGDQLDPQNLLLHRARVRRLQGEAIRDQILAVSGRLDQRMHGRSVPVHLTPFMQGRGRPKSSGPLDGDGRRSIYMEVHRNFLPTMMLTFDMPIPFSTIGRRNVSNVPAQALILMNDPFVVQQSQLWAQRVLAQGELTPRRRIDNLYLTAFARPPDQQEMTDALAFLAQQARQLGLPDQRWQNEERLWADLCHVLMNVKEFIYIN